MTVGAFAVVTTIFAPTKAITRLATMPVRLIVIGDHKTPSDWHHPGAVFYPLAAQAKLPHTLAIRENHYARKNLGYLEAIRHGATCIYDTDDDNVPLPSAWRVRAETCTATPVQAPTRWCNVYRFFHESGVWPRGFPLARLVDDRPASMPETTIRAPIQQGLADGEPDVDAIWRLAAIPAWMRGRYLLFRNAKSIALEPGTWCPFNSQTTWWFPAAYPLLYLPQHATFRMADIWRSFVAQRCLWAAGHRLVFHSPSEVMQDRNQHDLMHDFADEVPGYLHNADIAATLDELKLQEGEGGDEMADNIARCYRALVRMGVLPGDELPAVDAWLTDVARARVQAEAA